MVLGHDLKGYAAHQALQKLGQGVDPKQHSSRSILLTYSPKRCTIVCTSNVSGTHACPFFLILCTTPSSSFTMPPGALQLWLLPRLPVSVPPVAHWAISLPSSLLPFSVVSRTSHTNVVRVGISFVVLMDFFLMTSSEIFLFFSFAGRKDGGCWSVLGPLVEQVEVT
jgi:hypothetical protein